MKSTSPVAKSLGMVACALLTSLSLPATAQTLYWSELIPGGGPGGNSAATDIKRSDISGSGVSTIVPTSNGLGVIHTIKYEPGSNKLYWTDSHRGLIQTSNPDGSNIQTAVTSTLSGQPTSVRGLAIDSIHSTMYWTDETYATVKRANLDGSGATDLVNGILSEDIAIDVPLARLFFANNVGGPEGPHDAIDTSNFDGSGHHTIISGIYQLTALDVDPVGQKIYWADVGLNALNDTSIHRANFDGSGAQTLLSNLPDVVLALDVVPELNSIFWTSRDDGTIKRAALNGANAHTVVSGLSEPGALLTLVPEPSSRGLLWVGALLLVGGRRTALSVRSMIRDNSPLSGQLAADLRAVPR